MRRDFKIFSGLIALGVGLIMGLKYLFPLVAPFLLGIVFAALVEPWIKWLENRIKIPRTVGAGLTVGITIIILLLCIFGAGNAIYRESQRLGPLINDFFNQFEGSNRLWQQLMAIHVPLLQPVLQGLFVNSETLSAFCNSFTQGITSAIARLPELFFLFGLGGMTAYFVSRDKQRITGLFYQNLPWGWRPLVIQIKIDAWTHLTHFFRVEIALAIWTGLATLTLMTVLGIPGAPAYAVLCLILDFLPVLGPGLIYLPMAAVYWIYEAPHQATWLLGAYIGIMLCRQVLEYRLVGTTMKFHPLITMFVIYMGMKIFGLAGIIWGPVLVFILQACYRTLIRSECALSP